MVDTSFTLSRGKILGIVGESGSGKSVACYSLLGLLPSPPARIISGRALFDGIDLLALNDRQLRAIRGNRIAIIFQDPMTCLNPYMTVAQQLMEPLCVHRNLPKSLARSRAIEALQEVGIHEAQKRINCYPHEFSGGMRQRVMIAMALINEPEILIADEPTTALDVSVQAQILRLIRQIQKRRSLTVIFISHDLAVVADLADDVLVMKKGQVVEVGNAKAVLHNPQQPYTQRLVAAIPRTAKCGERKYREDDADLLSVRGLTKSFSRGRSCWFLSDKGNTVRALENISLTIKRGEILGLVGESGSGKTTLGRSIIRLLEVDRGEIVFNGIKLMGLSSADLRSMRSEFQMIFQDPYASLNPRMTVFDILVEPLAVHKIVPKNKFLEEVSRLMDDVGLGRDMIRKYPHEFSGGQRQRIAIARALAMRPKFIVADEPVSALDVTIQSQILHLLLGLTEKYRLAMLFISHDLSVIRLVSDRVLVMRAGRIIEEGDTEELFHNPREDYTKALLSAVAHI